LLLEKKQEMEAYEIKKRWELEQRKQEIAEEHLKIYLGEFNNQQELIKFIFASKSCQQ